MNIFLYLSGIRNDSLIFVVVAVIIAALVVDTSFIRIYSFSSNNPSLYNVRIAVFTVIAIVGTLGQYLVLEFIRKKSNEIRRKGQLHLNITHRIVTLTQYLFVVILAAIILEMVITSVYSTLMIIIAVGISYVLAIAILGFLSQRFFSWFRSNRNSVVLLYGLTSSILAVNAGITFAFVGSIMLSSVPYIGSYIGASISPFIAPGSLSDILNYPYVISSVISFISGWVATILLLRHYSMKMRKARYAAVLSVPLIYFLIQFSPLFPVFISTFFHTEFVFYIYTLAFTFSKPVGGILFGIAFWVVARSLEPRSVVRDYMIISAYGLVLLFISNQAVLLVNIIYPPFGLVTISFMGLSSYFLLLGVYSSAISVSEDSKLRQSIRTFAVRESRLLDSIGTAHMEQEIQKRVIELTKQNQDRIVEETGIQSSLTEEDMKQYLQEVISEVQKNRSTTDKSNTSST
jgi:hypothetical protein